MQEQDRNKVRLNLFGTLHLITNRKSTMERNQLILGAFKETDDLDLQFGKQESEGKQGGG